MSLNGVAKNQGAQVMERILQAIEGIHYGSVEVIIHSSRVVQIERKEKLRLDPQGQDAPELKRFKAL
jgi:hypothetical protein